MPTDPDPGLAESVAERRIREAIERGEFDGLPGAGRPLELLGEGYDPDWWVKRWVQRERLTELIAELRRSVSAARVRVAAGVGGERAHRLLEELEARLAAAEAQAPDESGGPRG